MEQPLAPDTHWWRRRLFVAGVFALLGALVVVYGAGGLYFASQLDQRALSAAARRESAGPDYKVEVLKVTGDTVRLESSTKDRVAQDGTFGIIWEGGWGLLGAVLSDESGEVIRTFEHMAGAALEPGMMVDIDGHVYQGDPLVGLGLEFEDVFFEGELGTYPAWFVPGRTNTWFILVHGNGMTRLDGLRVLSTVADAGIPALLTTVRGDDGAPEDPAGRLTYGKHEWRDLEAAVQYATDHGAESVVLQGISFGGAIVMAFLLESPLASQVSGVVLDSPVLDFERAVEHQASRESIPLVGLPLPWGLVDVSEWIASLRFDVDWDYSNYLDRADELRTPIFLIHGTADDDVPLATSKDLASARPDLVRNFYTVEGARHTEAWNLDPAEYERRSLNFLKEVGALPLP